MKRMHISVGVDDLEQSIKFYNTLFGVEPSKSRPDYAKWMLEDPRLNFAISKRAADKGVNHLGLQVDEDVELEELRNRLRAADEAIYDEGETTCCYAQSDKSWVRDPNGVAWEAFRTMEDVELFAKPPAVAAESCCVPKAKAACC